MLDVARIRSKALKRFAARRREQDRSQLAAAYQKAILAALNVATHPAALDIPGFDFHELEGDRKGAYAVKVTGNWRVTYQWDDNGPFAVELEDYHGK